MAEHIVKSHNKTLLLYHLVFPAKYRRKVFSEGVEKTLKEVCLEMVVGYEIHFLEIGVDEDHAHFLVQSVPTVSVTSMVTKIKSITAKEIFKRNPEVKRMLWGGNFWTSGYYANTVGKYGSEKMIRNYVKNQGKKYKQLHEDQLTMFEGLV
jgi:putative transposase